MTMTHEPTPTAMLINSFFTARDARGLGPWDPPVPSLDEFWPLPVGARVVSANPTAVTIRLKGSRRSRWIGVQTDMGRSADWNRARNAVACEARDRILAAVESGAIVLGRPISDDSPF